MKNNPVIFFIPLTIFWFFNIGYSDLIKPDEGRYAEIAREMLVSGDYVVPRINDIQYFEKPPLQYWATALSLKTFGNNEWGARFIPAASGFLTIVSIFLFVSWFWSLSTAQLVASILCGSLFFTVMGRVNNLDMLLTFFMTLAALSLSVLFSSEEKNRERAIANGVLWFSVALGFLTKGLVAILLPGLVSFVFIIVRRDLSIFKKIWWIRGLLIFIVVTLPWLYLCSLRQPEFLKFFFIHEHFDRFLTKTHHREGPLWYFVPILAVGFFPWILFIFKKRKWDNKTLFFAIWSAVVFLFFSLSSSKLPPYILPIWPTLSILAATYLRDQSKPGDLKKTSWALQFLAVLFLLGFFIVPTLPAVKAPRSAFIEMSYYLLACGLFLFLSVHWIMRCRQQPSTKYILFGLCTFVSAQLAYMGYGCFSPSFSSSVTAEKIRPYLDTETTPLFSVRYYEQELPFYLQKLVTLVDYEGELKFGLENGDGNKVLSIDEFFKKWDEVDQGIIISEPKLLKDFPDLAHFLVYEDKRRVILAKKEIQSHL